MILLSAASVPVLPTLSATFPDTPRYRRWFPRAMDALANMNAEDGTAALISGYAFALLPSLPQAREFLRRNPDDPGLETWVLGPGVQADQGPLAAWFGSADDPAFRVMIHRHPVEIQSDTVHWENALRRLFSGHRQASATIWQRHQAVDLLEGLTASYREGGDAPRVYLTGTGCLYGSGSSRSI